MKAGIITCILFLIMLGMIVANAVYVCKTADRLTTRLETAAARTDDRMQLLQNLSAVWKKERAIIQISVPHDKIDTVDGLLGDLLVYAQSGQTTEFKKTTVRLASAFAELCALEKPTVVNIL